VAVNIDPEGVETGVLNSIADFTDKSVLEIGCGDGRMTKRFASSARYVHAIDTDPIVISAAKAGIPRSLIAKVRYEVADICDIKLPNQAYQIAVFAMSI
jgi:2-polyprenyl-3-methyl-5-hydroxy-6-metoxy-1,4-benzoquinol methylase